MVPHKYVQILYINQMYKFILGHSKPQSTHHQQHHAIQQEILQKILFSEGSTQRNTEG